MSRFYNTLSEKYQELVKAIIRPMRENYTTENLGPNIFVIEGKIYYRDDVTIPNKKGYGIKGSYFHCDLNKCSPKPCIIYLHGNCSSRMESLGIAKLVLKQGMSFFNFDFSGCGQSEGPFISLGYFERDDVEIVLKYLNEIKGVNTFGLWGRSMGAVTALMYSRRDLRISAIVADSPFESFYRLALELADKHAKIPAFLIKFALRIVRNSVKREAGFDIYDLNTIKEIEWSFTPVHFIASNNDSLIDKSHSDNLFKSYKGKKSIRYAEGDHNTSRNLEVLNEAINLFQSHFEGFTNSSPPLSSRSTTEEDLKPNNALSTSNSTTFMKKKLECSIQPKVPSEMEEEQIE